MRAVQEARDYDEQRTKAIAAERIAAKPDNGDSEEALLLEMADFEYGTGVPDTSVEWLPKPVREASGRPLVQGEGAVES